MISAWAFNWQNRGGDSEPSQTTAPSLDAVTIPYTTQTGFFVVRFAGSAETGEESLTASFNDQGPVQASSNIMGVPGFPAYGLIAFAVAPGTTSNLDFSVDDGDVTSAFIQIDDVPAMAGVNPISATSVVLESPPSLAPSAEVAADSLLFAITTAIDEGSPVFTSPDSTVDWTDSSGPTKFAFLSQVNSGAAEATLTTEFSPAPAAGLSTLYEVAVQ